MGDRDSNCSNKGAGSFWAQ